MNPNTTAAPSTICRDAFARHPESIVGLAGGATCAEPVPGPGWMCRTHADMAHAALSTVMTDVPDEREAKQRREAQAMDPAIVARIDAARTFLAGYEGADSFLADLRADKRYGTKWFRLTEKMADAILRVRDREAAAANPVATERQPRIAEAVEWMTANAAGNSFAASLLSGYRRWGSLTDKQYAAVIRNVGEPGAPAEKATEGWYRHDGDVFKVQKAVHGSGNLYAKRLDVTSGTWEYAPGMVNRLTERLSVEEAAAMGRLYGRCVVCGRTLTDETSIEAGIGPVCRKRLA